MGCCFAKPVDEKVYIHIKYIEERPLYKKIIDHDDTGYYLYNTQHTLLLPGQLLECRIQGNTIKDIINIWIDHQRGGMSQIQFPEFVSYGNSMTTKTAGLALQDSTNQAEEDRNVQIYPQLYAPPYHPYPIPPAQPMPNMQHLVHGFQQL